jgi:large subunit ribosomal protein L18
MRKRIRNEKEYKRKRRHLSIRRKVSGTPERPRVAVFRSNEHIYAQIIDDTTGTTIASVSSLKVDRASLSSAGSGGEDEGQKKEKKKSKKKAAAVTGAGVLMAREVGRLLAETAKEKGVTRIAFDRGGYLYHGRVKALAESARENGLEF